MGGRNQRAILGAWALAVSGAVAGSVGAVGVALAQETDGDPRRRTESGGVVTLPTLRVQGTDPGYQARRSATATKTDTALRDVPQAVSVATRELIDDLGHQSMADVVAYVPGVRMGQGEGHRDAPVLRGNISTADFFVDGVRDDVQYFRDLYNAERIEILKGPNAMIFGRGGGGGVINRVTKQADGVSRGRLGLEAGSFADRRGEIDVGAAVTGTLAVRVNGMVEGTESYRDYFDLTRVGINPTVTYQPAAMTRVRLSYEYLEDDRTVDRGVPSQAGTGRPFRGADRSQFFGNPDLSYAQTQVHLTQLSVEHELSERLRISNKTVFAVYDKFYQNVYPSGPVAASGTGTVALDGYHSGTQRRNVFNQTDLVWTPSTGSVAHTILAGVEAGRQWTDNYRNNTSAGQLPAPVSVSNPVSLEIRSFFNAPVASSTNHVDVTVLGVYVQDQIKLAPWLEIVGGVRYDRVEIDVDGPLSTPRLLSRKDGLLSPRGGIVVKPIDSVSLYGSYSVSHLPQSGDQFASLSATTSALRPEKFENIEFGIKWDIAPRLSATVAVYRLDRDNTTAPGPAGTTVLTGSQRSEGVELEIAGEVMQGWQVLGGYVYQNARVASTTSAAPEGRRVPIVPLHSASLWNKVQVTPRLAAGVGVVSQSEVYASVSNAVKLPSYTRVDAALFVKLTERVQAQVNVENIFNRGYYSTAHNDNNITPGRPVSVRGALKIELW